MYLTIIVVLGYAQIDINTDGMVDFTEFVAATLHVHQMAELDTDKWYMRCQSAFNKFDIDGDGFITPDELRVVCVISSLSIQKLYL
jgi:Ca2+-binding EF-hand superfamily protein